MSILNEMQTLMAKTPLVVVGTIESIEQNSIVVISSQGVRRFWVPSASVYAVKDRVQFQGEVLLGRVTPETSIPYFSV
jgi:hypothetical protein